MQQSIRKFPFFDFQAPTKQVEKVNVQKNDDLESYKDVIDLQSDVNKNNGQLETIKQDLEKENKEEQDAGFTRYSPEEIATLKQKEYKKGWEEAYKKHLEFMKVNQKETSLKNDKERNYKDTLLKIEQELQSFNKKITLSNQGLIKDCADLCYEMAQKIINKSIRNFSKEMLVEFFNQNLSQITNISNNIKVMINKMDYEKLKLYIHKNKNKFGDNVNFIADKDVKSGDCVIKWQNGTIERNKDLILKEFENLLLNYFNDTNNQC